jgi:hypothetical protein
MKSLLSLPWNFLLLWAFSIGACSAATADCTSNITSASDAIKRADWIVDADVTYVVKFNSQPMQVGVGIENPMIMLNAASFGPHFLPVMDIADCYKKDILWNKESHIEGKRLRFFGKMFADSPKRRVFFAQILSTREKSEAGISDFKKSVSANEMLINEEADRLYRLLLEDDEQAFRKTAVALCNKGNVRAKALFGAYLYQKNEFSEAERWLTDAAIAGNAEAQFQLGLMLIFKMPGKQDAGFDWEEISAKNGNLKAKNLLDALSHPPRLKGNEMNVSDYVRMQTSIGTAQLDSTSDALVACFKYTKKELVEAVSKTMQDCSSKTRSELGEWSEPSRLLPTYASCIDNAHPIEKRVQNQQFMGCMKQLGIK